MVDLSLSEVANKNYSKKWPTEGLSFLGRLRQFNEGVCIMAYAKEATKRGGFEVIRVANKNCSKKVAYRGSQFFKTIAPIQ